MHDHGSRPPYSDDNNQVLSDMIGEDASVGGIVKSCFSELSINIDMMDMIGSQMMDAGRTVSGDTPCPTSTSVDIRGMMVPLEAISRYMDPNNIDRYFVVSDEVGPRMVFTDLDESLDKRALIYDRGTSGHPGRLRTQDFRFW